jgi:hypothetical protein
MVMCSIMGAAGATCAKSGAVGPTAKMLTRVRSRSRREALWRVRTMDLRDLNVVMGIGMNLGVDLKEAEPGVIELNVMAYSLPVNRRRC